MKMTSRHAELLRAAVPPVVILILVLGALWFVNSRLSDCQAFECIIPAQRAEPEFELYATHSVFKGPDTDEYQVSGTFLHASSRALPAGEEFMVVLLVYDRSGAMLHIDHRTLGDGVFTFTFRLRSGVSPEVINLSVRRRKCPPADSEGQQNESEQKTEKKKTEKKKTEKKKTEVTAPRAAPAPIGDSQQSQQKCEVQAHYLASATIELPADTSKKPTSRLSLEKDGNTLRLLFAIFAAGLMSIGIVRLLDSRWRWQKTVLTMVIFGRITLACFAATMAVVILRGYHTLTSGDLKSELVSIGLGYVQKGRFSALASDDWLFMFDIPAPAKDGTIAALGAPVWVIMFATLGAGIMVTRFLLDEIPEAKIDNETNRLRDHFLAVAFAPLGAIFVYQVASKLDLANRELIASSALASGLAMGHVLDRSIAFITEHFPATPAASPPSAPASVRPADGSQANAGEASPQQNGHSHTIPGV
ncbi:hypothetical protein OV079_29105 [Nannocystis pusilla]|uniref:Uncharacterized protein n=1 Tax=Nannocystis pusilla TaxID=889268 RepID=A0A9X3IYH6_9BACT|nr:hypothetical protein [Nannocystis pusilla]MCY1009552.1 hypothetical protein [Nannocystis pusilla]